MMAACWFGVTAQSKGSHCVIISAVLEKMS